MEYVYYNIKHKVKSFTPDYFLTNQRDVVQKIAHEINQLVLDSPEGSLFFIGGLPFILGNITEFLTKNLKFNYWIACEFNPFDNEDDFSLTHFGLLFLQKISHKKSVPFELKTQFFRVPHSTCPSCGNLTKDWGGKKHTMNMLGTAFSDVWFIGDELPEENLSHNRNIKKIISGLIGNDKTLRLVNSSEIYDDYQQIGPKQLQISSSITEFQYDDKVVNGDCINLVEEIINDFPDGIFDIAFSDPPYNLNKNYSKYEDNLKDQEYLEWCEKWLFAKYKSLKPGGSLLVMNIPKWSIHHFNFLKKIMIFDKWIVWDALSTPAGKLMPAHYSILHFIKPGGKKKINTRIEQIPQRDYCLRSSCIKKRKEITQVNITDIWKDCHRVKHNKNKNDHPCQLPIKLLDRIITKYTFKNDRVFDPFGGTGSAAVSARINDRRFTITDIDQKYCEIANTNIDRVIYDENGNKRYVIEPSVKSKTKKTLFNSKKVEEDYMLLCQRQNGIVEMEDILSLDNELYNRLQNYPKNFKKLKTMTKRLKLHNNNT